MLATALLPSQAALDGFAWSTGLTLDELDQPDIAGVLDVWRTKRQDGRLPARAAFDLTDLKRALSHVMILDVRNGSRDFVFRLAGSETAHLHQRELTGHSISDVGDRYWQAMMRRDLAELVDRAEPQLVRLRYRTASGLPRDHKELRLPLSDDGQVVDRILIMQDFTIEFFKGAMSTGRPVSAL